MERLLIRNSDWPPKTFPRPSGFPAPRLDGLPPTRGDCGIRKKSLRPQRLSGEKGLPQRRRDAEGLFGPGRGSVDGDERKNKLKG